MNKETIYPIDGQTTPNDTDNIVLYLANARMVFGHIPPIWRYVSKELNEWISRKKEGW